jgi:hypothetical protein
VAGLPAGLSGFGARRQHQLISPLLNAYMSRFPFGELTSVIWDNCFGGADTSDGGAADCLSQKGFWMATTTIAPGVEIDVYNLHDEAGNTPLDQQFRTADRRPSSSLYPGARVTPDDR